MYNSSDNMWFEFNWKEAEKMHRASERYERDAYLDDEDCITNEEVKEMKEEIKLQEEVIKEYEKSLLSQDELLEIGNLEILELRDKLRKKDHEITRLTNTNAHLVDMLKRNQ